MLALRSRRLLAVVLPLVTVAAVSAGTRAEAAYPGPPTGEHVIARTPTSFTVGMNTAANATAYKVAASTVESDIYYANINKPSPHKKFAQASHPTIPVTGLPYTAASYYYRVATVNGSIVRWSSAYHATNLKPYTPTGLTIHQTTSGVPRGTWLTWSSHTADGFQIQQATNTSFTSGVHLYTTKDGTLLFTPWNMVHGGHYYFRVRGQNGTALSSWTGTSRSVSPVSTGEALRVVTYNILGKRYDGTQESGNTISPWSQRLPGVVELVNEAGAALIGLQEGNGLDGASTQAEEVADALPSNYVLDPTHDGTNGDGAVDRFLGNYIIYDKNIVTPDSSLPGGYWNVGTSPDPNPSHSVYQVFNLNGTSARILYVVMHIDPNTGADHDAARKAEIDATIHSAKAYAAYKNISSIVYTGDTNAWPNRIGQSYDAPGQEMRANGYVETNGAAQVHYNLQYASINRYLRIPPLGGSADRAFVSGGTSVQEWLEKLHLVNGQFSGVIPSDHNPVVSDLRVPAV